MPDPERRVVRSPESVRCRHEDGHWRDWQQRCRRRVRKQRDYPDPRRVLVNALVCGDFGEATRVSQSLVTDQAALELLR